MWAGVRGSGVFRVGHCDANEFFCCFFFLLFMRKTFTGLFLFNANLQTASGRNMTTCLWCFNRIQFVTQVWKFTRFFFFYLKFKPICPYKVTSMHHPILQQGLALFHKQWARTQGRANSRTRMRFQEYRAPEFCRGRAFCDEMPSIMRSE